MSACVWMCVGQRRATFLVCDRNNSCCTCIVGKSKGAEVGLAKSLKVYTPAEGLVTVVMSKNCAYNINLRSHLEMYILFYKPINRTLSANDKSEKITIQLCGKISDVSADRSVPMFHTELS